MLSYLIMIIIHPFSWTLNDEKDGHSHPHHSSELWVVAYFYRLGEKKESVVLNNLNLSAKPHHLELRWTWYGVMKRTTCTTCSGI